MKGLELSRRYLTECVMPGLQRWVPQCLPHTAAGLIGGSQAYGNDDEVSRDHAWGAVVMLWLLGDARERLRGQVEAVCATTPREFLGYPAFCSAPDLGALLEQTVGCRQAPTALLDWLRIPEQYVFEVAYAPVFRDPTGEVTRCLQGFADYPEEVRLYRLNAHLFWMAEWGLKSLRRAERRGDAVTAALSWARFAVQAMRVGFALSGRHAPYHKWLWREFGKLPAPCTEVGGLLEAGFASGGEHRPAVDAIVEVYLGELRQRGLEPRPLAPEHRARMAYPETAEVLSYCQALGAELAARGAPEQMRGVASAVVLPPPYEGMTPGVPFKVPPNDGW